MKLPSELQIAIDEFFAQIGDKKKLQDAREKLSEKYRSQKNDSAYVVNETERQAYIISRLPATFAAVAKSLKAIQEIHSFSIKSILDLGSGPGTAIWAACEFFPDVEMVTCIEKDHFFIQIGKQMAQKSKIRSFHNATWLSDDLENITHLPQADLVIFSYSIGELQKDKIVPLLQKSWQSANQLLVVIEPGTPIGFERIRLIRKNLIDLKANLVAPCPHHEACPMKDGDWCHFSARVERSIHHRRVKQGKLAYEDEKFSYVAASKNPVNLPFSRILREPERHSGHIQFTLCTSTGVQKPILSKKMGEKYKLVRKLEWGDPFYNNK